MADGTVKITIEADGNKAIKSAKDLQAVLGQLGKGGQTSGLTEGLDDVSKHSNSAKTSILDMVTAIGLVKVASMAFNAVKDNIGSIINEGAKLQQSLGGVETLFKSSAVTVKKYADQAFKTAGLSANEYMENVTSFSASLISSMGGDTAKAAEVANMAMVDMSDNANKMGTNIGDIQNAYQGFAKQNYTMLDNLKLGYGGTQEEMKRLLADATKISHVKYDMSNLSDVYNAIHVIQKNLDITGTTAKEAASTFSGSFDSMSSAAKNVAGRIALGMDIKPALNDLAETMSTFIFGNFIPMITNIFKALPSAISQFARAAVPKIAAVGRQIEEALGVNFEAIPANLGLMFDNLFSDVNFSKVVQGMSVIIDPIRKVLQSVANLVNGAVIGISFALEGIKAAMDKVFDGSGIKSFGSMVNSIADSVSNSLIAIEVILMNVGQILASLNWVAILTGVKVAVGALMGTVKELADIISVAFNNDIFKGLVVGILSAFAAFKTFAAVSAIVTSVATKVTALIGVIKNVGAGISILFNAIKSGKEIVAAFNLVLGVNPFVLLGVAIAAIVAGLVYFFAKTQSGQKIWANFTKFLSDAWNSLKDIASNTWTAIVNTFTGAADGVKSGWSSITTFFSNLWNGIVTSSTAAWSGVTQALSAIWQGTVMVAQTIWGGISAFFTALWNGIVSIATSVWNIFGTSLTTIWQGIVSVAQGVWEMLKGVIMGPILILIDLLTGNWNQLGADLQLIWASIVNAASLIWNGLVTYFTGILSFIGTYFSTVWNGISAAAIAIWNGIVSAGQAIWNGFVSALSAIWSGLVNSAISFWNALKNGTISIFNGLVNGSVALWNGLVLGVKSLVSNLVSGVVSMLNGLKSSVIAIANGIKNGAINAWNGMVSGVRNVVSTVISVFNGLRNIDLLAAGRAVINGFIKGLTGAWEAGKKFISGIGDWIREHKGPISYDKRLLIPAGNAIMSGLNKGLVDNFGTVKDSIADITEGIANSAVITMPAIEDSAFNKSLKRINNTLNSNRLSAGLSFAGITAENATGIGRGVTPTNSVVNNYSNTATTTVQTAKESNDKVLEALNKIANNRPVAVVDGSSFAPAYEQYGSTETARRSQMKGRGLAVDSKF